MRAFNLAAAHVDRGGNHFIRSQLIHYEADRCNISHCVHRADFVEMYFGYRHAVYMAFSLSNQPQYA